MNIIHTYYTCVPINQFKNSDCTTISLAFLSKVEA